MIATHQPNLTSTLTRLMRAFPAALLCCTLAFAACDHKGPGPESTPTPAKKEQEPSLVKDPTPATDTKPDPDDAGDDVNKEDKPQDADAPAKPASTGGVRTTPYSPPTAAPEGTRIAFEGGIDAWVDCDDERVEVLAQALGGVSRPLEFLIVSPGGANHEALIEIAGRPYDLHQALQLIFLKPAKADEKLSMRGDLQTPKGDQVRITAIWTDDDGEMFETPLEDWVLNTQTNKPLTPGPWVFSGSIEEYQPEIGRSLYLADQVSNVVALWRDPSCVLDNPRESGATPHIYRVNHVPKAMPNQFRQVTLVFRKWRDE